MDQEQEFRATRLMTKLGVEAEPREYREIIRQQLRDGMGRSLPKSHRCLYCGFRICAACCWTAVVAASPKAVFHVRSIDDPTASAATFHRFAGAGGDFSADRWPSSRIGRRISSKSRDLTCSCLFPHCLSLLTTSSGSPASPVVTTATYRYWLVKKTLTSR